jgi:O-antigen ligase
MGLQSPWHGLGYNGYRVDCFLPRFNVGLPALNIPPTQLNLGSCEVHPQNFYIQAFSDTGVPGLFLFMALMLIWTLEAAKGLFRSASPLRIGLFIGVLTFTWPLASTDEFPSLYMLGWFFFILGFSLTLTKEQEGSALKVHQTTLRPNETGTLPTKLKSPSTPR